MHYATPAWMKKQIPAWMWSRYEIHIIPYGTNLSSITDINPKTTALIVLLDPSTKLHYVKTDYGNNTYMFYNEANWGRTNRSMVEVADRINATGGKAESINLQHKQIPGYFFSIFKSDDN
jgi:hypothetical protein